MATLRDDFYHLVPDAVILKRLAQQRQTLTCYCCRDTYQRGSFRCCAPPKNMNSSHWREMRCPDPKEGGCGKCPRHCQCPSKKERLGEGPLANLARRFLSEYQR